MKIPLRVHCDRCGSGEYIFLNLNETSFKTSCKCGDVVHSFLASNVTVGYKILWRSHYELTERKDYPLSIVFSATAFECELTRLHFKWSQIGALDRGVDTSDEQLEKLLRKYQTINSKIEGVCKLMDSRGFRGFVSNSPELSNIVKDGFPSLSLYNLAKDFQQNLFWPRNRVLHLADTSFSYEDAKRCFNIATLGLRILDVMDEHRRSAV